MFARQAVGADMLFQCVFAVSTDRFCGFTGSPRPCRTPIPGAKVIASTLARSSLSGSHEYQHCRVAEMSGVEQQGGFPIAHTEVQQKSSARIYPAEAARASPCASLAQRRNTNGEERHQTSDHQGEQAGLSTKHFEQFLQPVSQSE